MVTGAITPQPSTMSTVNTQQNSAPAEPVKRSSDNRRSNKPIMEKRRRARINNCLNELKTLILDAMKKDPARHSKLEKADILEMTVKHLENLQRQQNAMSQATDPNVLNKFKAGFTECANEVGRFPELEPMVKRRLLQHLSNCINGVKTELPQKQRTSTVQVHILPSPPSSPDQHQPEVHHQTQVSQITATTNGYFVTNGVGTGVQLIPTKLANGSIAFVLPQQISAAATPVPMLVPIPTRTSSTGSAASSHSSSAYERVPQEHSPYHSPPSPANSNYEPMDCQTTPHQEHYYQHHQQQQQQHQYNHHPQQQQRSYSPSSAPLSLVVRKSHEHEIKEDERPWRPW